MFPRFLLFPALATGALFAPGSSSPQGAFSVSSREFREATPLHRAAEEAEKTFFQLTRYAPGDAPPVQLLIEGKGTPASLAINAVEGGGPALRLVIPADPDDPQVAPFLATALLLREYYGKTTPVQGSRVPRFPDWLTRGLGTLILQRPIADAASMNTELAAFLTERVPDPDHVSLLRRYDAVASVLVRSGLSEDGGRKAFRDWVGTYDPSAPPRQPSFWVDGWEMRAVERRWNLGLQVPEEREPLSVRIKSPASTLEEYRRIMQEGMADKASLADVSRDRGGAYRLQMLGERLTALRLQANPLAIPLLERTMKLVASAGRTSPKRIRQEEENLLAEDRYLRKQARAIEDYLDWYEAAKVATPSGVFDHYLSTPASTVAKGPIGRHLDAVESRGW